MAAPPVGTGDQSTQQLLDQAYTDSRSALQGAGTPSNLLKPYSGPGPQSSSTSSGQSIADQPAQADLTPSAEPPPGAENPFDSYGKPPDGAEPVTDKQTHGNGDLWSLSNLHDFFRDEFKGSQEEAGKGIMRVLAKAGGALTTLGGGAAGATVDSIADWIVGKGPTHHAATDAVFDFKKKYIDPAIEYWTPERQSVAGQGEGSGPGAQAIGGAAELAPALATGPAGVAAVLGGIATESMTGAINKGHSLRSAAAEGAIDTVATAIQMMVPGAKLPFVKRALVQVPAGDMAAVTGAWAKKKVLEANGYTKEANEINPLDNLGENTLQNVVFAAIGGEKPKEQKAAAPVPEATTPDQTPPTVATPAASPEPVSPPLPAQPSTPAKPAAVPDKPSPEPAKDLKAQFADMNDKSTPRSGVLISKGTVPDKGVGNQVAQAKNQGRVIDLPQGTLVFKTTKDALAAREAIKKGTDPQEIIGKATGAGSGKTPEQTVVVQGHTPEGAVATESMVKPSEVNAKVAEVQAQGKAPVVTTPELAVQRRAAEIAQEKGEPPKNAEPVRGDAIEGREAHEDDEEEPAPKVDRAIIKTPQGERAVIVDDATPDKDGKVAVRMLDDDGEPAGSSIRVAQDLVRGKAESASAPAKEATPPKADVVETPAKAEPAKENTAENDDGVSPIMPPQETRATEGRSLSQILKDHGGDKVKRALQGMAIVTNEKSAEAPKAKAAPLLEQLADAHQQFKSDSTPPSGKKYPASVKDRAGTVANFARVLKGVAEHLQGKAPVADIQRAIATAKKAERLDLKSDEAINKGQGVGHAELAVHEHNLQQAAERLINPEHVMEPAKIAMQEKLKAKVAKAKKPKAEPKAKVEELPKEKTAIKDVEDETKPKALNAGERQRLKAAGERLIKAKDEDLDARKADVEKTIDEIYGKRLSSDDRDMLMYSIMAERRERLTPKTRDEEIEDEFSDQRHDNGDEDPLESRILGAHEVSPEMADLHARLEKSGMYPKMREYARLGKNHQFDAQQMLEHMAGNAKGAMKDFLTKLAAHMPKGAKIRPVDVVHNPSTGVAMTSQGLFTRSSNLIQVVMKTGGDTKLTHAIIHEAVHAATTHLAGLDPTHPFVKEAKRLRDIFIDRMKRRLGDQLVQAHVDYHNGKAGQPTDYVNNLYGLKNHLEFMAEAMSNPKLQQLIAESEAYRGEREGFIGGAHKLADAVVGAIKRALNIVTNREAKLLHSVMRNVEDIMEAQKTALDAPHDAVEDMLALHSLDDDPKPLREEWKIRSTVGDTAATTARQFYRATQSRAVHALRSLILKNETHDQIIRSNAHWFGKDNEKNPLRQYDNVQQEKNAISNRVLERARDVVLDRQRLTRAEDRDLGDIQIKSTQWGIDPSKPQTDVAKKTSGRKDFQQRWDDIKGAWDRMSDAQKAVYTRERDHYQYVQKQMRKVGIDAALDTFSDRDVTPAQRALLYSARDKADYDGLIGQGKLIDVGDRNEGLKSSLKDLAAVNEVRGPYFHLGRHGEYVVQVKPEGLREFKSQAEAEDYAAKIRDFGPGSKAKVDQIGGKWTVDYKAQYVSMHETAHQAEQVAGQLRSEGHDVDQVTRKVQAQSGGALTGGMQTLVAEASRKLERRGSGPETQALADSLRGTFVQMVAARSSYAASKLARRGFAGVKPEEMGRNFASHATSTAWNIGNLATVFKQGEALGRVREMAKSPEPDVPQKTVYKRGAVMDVMGKRLAQEVSQYGLKNPLNAITAKLGYMNFLASPAHTIVNLTQNFTTAIPVAAARWGLGKSTFAFVKASRIVAGPTLRATMNALKPGRFTADDMAEAVVKAVAADKDMGKWAPALREMMDRGVMSSTFASELGHIGQGGNHSVQRVFDYARILPQLAEVYNRVSTALVGLEMTGGDVAKSSDFVREAHVDYTQSNKTQLAKTVAKVPGANTLTMFRTYIQGMRHLLYSNIKNMVFAETKSRAEAAKTVAGLILAQSLFAGVIKGAVLEPLKASVYAYNKLFGDDDKYFSLDNSIRRFISGLVGNKKLADAISGGLPHLLGFDLSGRMGLSDLFLHDPPDLLAADKSKILEFAGQQLGGPMVQMVAEQKDAFVKAMDKGDAFGMLAALVPIKMLRDSLKAGQLASTGKLSGAGGQTTKPSALDAAYQVIGLKPASVAQAQERQGEVAQYRQFGSERKQRIMNQAQKGMPTASLMDQVRAYNAANPGDRISVGDFKKQQRAAQRATATTQGGPTRDPNVRKLLDY